MKDLWFAIKVAVGTMAFAIVVSFILIRFEMKTDELMWNDGYCQCGDEWTFSNAMVTKNGTKYYYYHCSGCGNIIETNYPQIEK